jgi:glycerol kinase
MDSFSEVALDIGSTSIKCAGLNSSGELELIAQQPSPKLKHEEDKVCGDVKAYIRVCIDLLDKAKARSVKGCSLAITSQRSTFVVWNKQGDVLSPLISWQDRFYGRDALLGLDQIEIQNVSGLVPSPYYLGPKLKGWMKQAKTPLKDMLVGTLDTYLIWVLSQRKYFVMDRSMAARSALLDLATGEWSSRLLEMFNVDKLCLPSLVRSRGLEIDLEEYWVLRSLSADQSASLYGHDPKPGDICVNFGTGVFVMKVEKKQNERHMSYQNALFYEDAQRHYFCEGAVNGLSRALQQHQILLDSTELIENDTYCVVDSSGLGAPYWRSEVEFQCTLENFDRKSHDLKRSVVLEGLIFRVYEIISDLADQNSRILVSGGASRDKILIKTLALLCEQRVFSCDVHDSSLRGALKFLNPDLNELVLRKVKKTDNTYLEGKYKIWKKWMQTCLK